MPQSSKLCPSHLAYLAPPPTRTALLLIPPTGNLATALTLSALGDVNRLTLPLRALMIVASAPLTLSAALLEILIIMTISKHA